MVVKLFDYIFFCRPMLMIPVWTVYLHFKVAGDSARESFAIYSWQPSWLDVTSLIVLTLVFAGVYVLNQIFDVESDRINDKLFFLPREMISISAAWKYYAVLSAAGIGMSLGLPQVQLPVVVLIVILGVLYSIPKIKLKDRAVSGLIANALAFGLIVPLIDTANLRDGEVVMRTLPYFLAIVTGYILTTIPDYHGDMASGKRTLAVILRPMTALRLAVLTGFAAIITSIGLENYEVAAVSAMAFFLSLGALTTKQDRHVMVACKAPIVFLTILAGLHYPWYLIFLLLTIALTRIYYKKRFGIIYPQPG